jgi:hypothetical protein
MIYGWSSKTKKMELTHLGRRQLVLNTLVRKNFVPTGSFFKKVTADKQFGQNLFAALPNVFYHLNLTIFIKHG